METLPTPTVSPNFNTMDMPATPMASVESFSLSLSSFSLSLSQLVPQGMKQLTEKEKSPSRIPDQENAIKTTKQETPRTIHGWRWVLAGRKNHYLNLKIECLPTSHAAMAIFSSVFLFALDQTIVADIIPPIVEHFGDVAKLPWVSVSLLLAAAGTISFW